MGTTSKGGSKSISHHLFKDNARNRVDELQGMLKDLQFAIKENRKSDIAVLEERMNHMMSEWKAELNEPSPASSQNDGSLGSFSSDLFRLLVEDDATSQLTHPTNPNPEPETNSQNIPVGDNWDIHEIEDYFFNQELSDQEFHRTDQFKDLLFGQQMVGNSMNGSVQLDYHQCNVHHDIDHHLLIDSDGTQQCVESLGNQVSSSMCTPSAFLGPKCALWDCVRPAKGLEGYDDYCHSLHAILAKKESPPGSAPVMRCGGISLKDNVLFAALIAKTEGKDVGIPECEGAATTKSPWNAPEFFNLVLEGETLKEWLFFDKPRGAFGNKKQRSLPGFNGRGWHESRKLMIKEYGGLKKSYYMEPQPLYNSELHLYIYMINNSDMCALYRLELKLADEKKSPKGNVSDDKSLGELQTQNSRFSGEFSPDGSYPCKEIFQDDVEYNLWTPNQKTPTKESCFYGDNFVKQTLHELGSQEFDHFNCPHPETQHSSMKDLELSNQLDYHRFDLHQEFGNNTSIGFVGSGQCKVDNKYIDPGVQSSMCHPSFFVGPKCALWDCCRPAQVSDYCSLFHGTLALNEGLISMTPVLRPRGISLNDASLFTSLSAKIHGKDVGIPECEGAATTKSPWNSPELFDIYFSEGETIREWLFFDKPRKAFESGKRKQRSLPDHKGRGWHESRKQQMKEFGGVKKSFYMDPQPLDNVEWHLYEYQIDDYSALILCRLELKEKKSPKGKGTKDPVVDLQKQMDRLNSDFVKDNEKQS